MSFFTLLSRHCAYNFGLILLMVCASQTVFSQDMTSQRKRGREMLNNFKKDIKDNFYDPNFHGINLDAHFKAAEEQVNNAVSGDQIYGIIAQTLLAFEDSHTYFIPPFSSLDVDYGWEMMMIGDKCMVTSVSPNSDAHIKGLRRGDIILSVFDIPVTRANLWQIKYLFYGLRPLNAMRVLVQVPDGKPKQIELLTKIEKNTLSSLQEKLEKQPYSSQYYLEVENELFVWRMPQFNLSEQRMEDIMKKVRRYKALILDLRDNGGGYDAVLQRLLGYFFDHEVTIAELKGRKESKTIVVKSQGKSYKGQIIVLVDSTSASASEYFARVIQLEKRGIVIGDRTAGQVMQARYFYHNYEISKGTRVLTLGQSYAISVTIYDIIMIDGKSLERVGVIPDEIILPTSKDLEEQNDPVLLRAAELTGNKVDIKKLARKPLL